MLLDPRALEVVALAAATVAVLSLLLALVLLVRLRRLARAHRLLLGDDTGDTFVQAVERMRATSTGLLDEVGRLRAQTASSLRHVAVVRYDAFGDTGGRLSHSVALLDDAADGLVLTAITGRRETRTYAKGVRAGGSDVPLSPEEQEAVHKARQPQPAVPAQPLPGRA